VWHACSFRVALYYSAGYCRIIQPIRLQEHPLLNFVGMTNTHVSLIRCSVGVSALASVVLMRVI